MKKLLKSTIVVLICIIVLCGCSSKNQLVGVYMAKSVSTPNDAIVLYDGGKCTYFGDNAATWEISNDVVTITKREPDKYYIDAYLDSSLTLTEKQSFGTKFNRIENVYSCTFFVNEGKMRIEIDNKNNINQTQENLSGISGVTSVEIVVLQGTVHQYTFNVIDNCLVNNSGNVYIRQGN